MTVGTRSTGILPVPGARFAGNWIGNAAVVCYMSNGPDHRRSGVTPTVGKGIPMREKQGPRIPGQDKRGGPVLPSKDAPHAQPKPKIHQKGGTGTRHK